MLWSIGVDANIVTYIIVTYVSVFFVCLFFCEQTIVCFIINFYHNKLQEKKINFQKYALFFFYMTTCLFLMCWYSSAFMCMKNQPHIFSVEVLYK